MELQLTIHCDSSQPLGEANNKKIIEFQGFSLNSQYLWAVPWLIQLQCSFLLQLRYQAGRTDVDNEDLVALYHPHTPEMAWSDAECAPLRQESKIFIKIHKNFTFFFSWLIATSIAIPVFFGKNDTQRRTRHSVCPWGLCPVNRVGSILDQAWLWVWRCCCKMYSNCYYITVSLLC